jgi:hypothetical protein
VADAEREGLGTPDSLMIPGLDLPPPSPSPTAIGRGAPRLRPDPEVERLRALLREALTELEELRALLPR